MANTKLTGTSPEIFDVWLADRQWSRTALIYGFPVDASTYDYRDSTAVTPLSAAQQDAVRKVFDEISSFTQLSFVEITEASGSEADLRFLNDQATDGSYSYYPRENEMGGDSFYGPQADNSQIGNEAYFYFLHEIGHVLGMKPGRDYQSFRESVFDAQDFTVVSYAGSNHESTPIFNSGPIDWAQSYMQTRHCCVAVPLRGQLFDQWRSMERRHHLYVQ